MLLAIDVSDSMAATDVRPSRLVAAERAAQQFTRDLPDRFKLGLIAFEVFEAAWLGFQGLELVLALIGAAVIVLALGEAHPQR